MLRITKHINLCILILVAGVFAVSPVLAADFPSKTITLVTWSSAGGGGDVLGRNLQRPLSKVAGVNVVVLNKPGGSGAVAMEYAEKMKPDGYHLLIVTASGVMTPHIASTCLSVADFKGVVRVQKDPSVVMVRADSPFKTTKDALEAKKANPGAIKFSGGFLGNIDSLLCYQLFKAAGIEKFDYVPYGGGGGEALTALLGGHVQVGIGNPSEVAPQVEAGQIRLIGVGTPERLPGMPELPTLREQGYDLIAVLWRGIVVPKGTADDKVMKLNQMIKQAMQDPAWLKYMKKSQLSDGYMTPSDFDVSIKEQYKTYGKIISTMGVKKKK